MAVGFTGTNFQAKPSILDPFRTIFDVLGPTWKSGLGQNLTRSPQPGLQIPELFSGPHSGTFFCALFVAFPGNATENVQKKVPEWGPEKKFRNLQAWLGVPGQVLAQT